MESVARRTSHGARRCGRADEDKWVVEFAGPGGAFLRNKIEKT